MDSILEKVRGSGRHARLMADALMMNLGGERFSWDAYLLLTLGPLVKIIYQLFVQQTMVNLSLGCSLQVHKAGFPSCIDSR
jgi:hypothetical protein